MTRDWAADWLNPRVGRTEAYLRAAQMMAEDEGRNRVDEFDATRQRRLKRFEDEFGSLTAIRREDGAPGRIVDFAKKAGELYWVQFEDPQGKVTRYTPDEIEIFKPHE